MRAQSVKSCLSLCLCCFRFVPVSVYLSVLHTSFPCRQGLLSHQGAYLPWDCVLDDMRSIPGIDDDRRMRRNRI